MRQTQLTDILPTFTIFLWIYALSLPDMKSLKWWIRLYITYAALVKCDLAALYLLMKGRCWQRKVNLIPAQIEETVRPKRSWHSQRKNPSDPLPGTESKSDMSVHLTKPTDKSYTANKHVNVCKYMWSYRHLKHVFGAHAGFVFVSISFIFLTCNFEIQKNKEEFLNKEI